MGPLQSMKMQESAKALRGARHCHSRQDDAES